MWLYRWQSSGKVGGIASWIEKIKRCLGSVSLLGICDMVQENWGYQIEYTYLNSQDPSAQNEYLENVGCPNRNVVPQKVGHGMMDMGM